jgi:UDP-3-O-[3-hydroxymyristoyl] glucosamine N-acyltransferase
MQLTAHQIGLLLEGTVEGNPDVTVNQLSKIEEASKGSLSFLANSKYEQFLYSSRASVIIINEDFILAHPTKATLIRVKNA